MLGEPRLDLLACELRTHQVSPPLRELLAVHLLRTPRFSVVLAFDPCEEGLDQIHDAGTGRICRTNLDGREFVELRECFLPVLAPLDELHSLAADGRHPPARLPAIPIALRGIDLTQRSPTDCG